ncbi:hypothetical protein CEP54_000081 [Fusarium duplospermum]|uniref:Uncharacterized protein n=1 Tax=Fusarium duplospermum TaxID=1325734 RepID=A0A428R8P8_9HYPO|nr:hypothetical protein CEP54_000081 [Fusarium duplospermum]
MPGLLGTPTFAKMSLNAAGRVWRRLKAKAQKGKKQGPEEKKQEEVPEEVPEEEEKSGSEEGGHTFYSDSFDTIGYTDSDVDTLECVETIQTWVNENSDTYDFFGAWSHPSEVSSLVSFEEPDLHRSVSFRTDPDEGAELAESGEPAEPVELVIPIKVIKPTKRGGFKDVFKNAKAAFKKRDHSG